MNSKILKKKIYKDVCIYIIMSTWTPWVLDAQMAAKQKALLNSRASDALKKMNDMAYTYEQRQEFAAMAIALAAAANNQSPTTAAEAEAADRARQRPIQS